MHTEKQLEVKTSYCSISLHGVITPQAESRLLHPPAFQLD